MRTPVEAAQYALNLLKNEKVDEAAISASLSTLNELTAQENELNLLRTTHNTTLSLQVIKNQKRGTLSINSWDDEAIKQAVNDCLLACASSEADEHWALSKEAIKRKVSDPTPLDLDSMINRTKELVAQISKDYPNVHIENVVTVHKESQSCYLNTNDVRFDTDSACYDVHLSFLGKRGDKTSGFIYTGTRTKSLDTPFIELANFRQELEAAQKLIDAQPMEEKFVGTVLFSPMCFTQMLYSALGNFVSDSSLIEGISRWKDKLGQKVASESLTVQFSVSDPRLVQKEVCTPEGFESKDFTLIKNGVLNSFMLSLYAANKTGHQRALNSGGGLIVPGGDTPYSDVIKNIDKGILVGYFSGGQPSPSGEFSGVAKNSFFIENGEIKSPLTETMMSGNLIDALQNIVAISKEAVEDGANVVPWVAINGITISGK